MTNATDRTQEVVKAINEAIDHGVSEGLNNLIPAYVIGRLVGLLTDSPYGTPDTIEAVARLWRAEAQTGEFA